MSAISLKSITGITSITTPAGVDNQLTLHNNNTTEAVKLDIAGNLHVNNQLAVTGVSTFSEGVIIPDSKALSLGNRLVGSTAGDLRIYHGSDNSYIDEIGAGNLYIRNNTNNSIFCQTSGKVELYYNGNDKLATTNTGVSVSGTLVAGALDISGDIDVDGHTNLDNVSVAGVSTFAGGIITNVSPAITIRDGTTEKGYIGFYANDPFIGRKNGVGLLFQDNKVRPVDGDTGIGTNNTVSLGEPTYKFKDLYLEGDIHIDSDVGQLRIGADEDLKIDHNGSNAYFMNGTGSTINRAATYMFENANGSTEYARITSTGKVGINQSTWSSKDHMLEVRQSTNDKEIARFTVDAGSGSVQGKGFIGLSAFNATTHPHAYIGVEEYGTSHYQGHLTFATRNASNDSAPTERLRITSTGTVLHGSGAVTTQKASNGGFDISCNTHSLVIGADSNSGSLSQARTNNAIKDGRIGHVHYTNAEEPIGLFRVSSTSTENTVWIGGGSSLLNAATTIQFNTAANNTTTNGTHRLIINSAGDVLIGTDTSAGNRLYVVDSFTDGFINPSDSILRIENANTSGTTTQTSISFTSKTSGSNADSAIVSQAEDASGNSRLEFWTDTSNGMTEKLVLSSTGKLSLTSNDGLFIRPTTDSNDAKITFSTNNNNGNNQIGHIKYNHQDNGILSGYGEGMIMGGTESNGFILRVDGAINIKDSDSAGGDGAKLLFGTDKDMRMYHSGGDGFIDGTGTGGLRIRYNDIIISNYNSTGTRRLRFQSDQGIEIFSVTNAESNGARIQFSDSSDQSQIGTIKYVHSDNNVVNDSTNECFVMEGSETQTAFKLDGRFYMSDDKFVMKPSFGNFDKIPNSGTGDGTSHQGVMMRCDGSQSSAGNSGVISNNAYEPFIANRSGNDGTVMRIRHQGNTEGEIKVNGSSVTYGNFMGSHIAQFVDHSKPDLLIGTVMEAVDQIATWKYASFSVGVGTDATTKFIPYYGSKNDGETDTITFESNSYNATIKNHRDPMPEITKHVCVKVSDTVGSKAVFGVFNCWQEENVVERESSNTEYAWNDLDVASIGNYFIRMQSGQTPAVGDYVESAGDGTAKVQSDDILRSKTIAKITSTIKQKTYSDGSFLVTCTLHCG